MIKEGIDPKTANWDLGILQPNREVAKSLYQMHHITLQCYTEIKAVFKLMECDQNYNDSKAGQIRQSSNVGHIY